MLNNYFKVAMRNLMKNRIPSFINIFGLSLAIGCAIVIFIFADYQLHMDSFHKDKANIYQLLNAVHDDKNKDIWGLSPVPLGPAIKDEFPDVSNTVRVFYSSAVVKKEDKVFSERISFVDKEYLEVFDFNLIYGGRKALYDNKQIVLSKNIAQKYFGETDPVGSVLTLKVDTAASEEFIIGAVAETFPLNASFGFDILLPYVKLETLGLRDPTDWNGFGRATFVQFKPGSVPDDIFDGLEKFRLIQNEANEKWPIKRFEFIPLDEISLRSFEIFGSASTGSHPAGRMALGVIAIFLLAMACFNYVNIAVVSATTRLKEIALRKVIGGQRKQIIRQFLVENILICFFALAVGTLMAYYLFLPGFNASIPITIPFEFSSFSVAVGFFGGLLLLIGLISGAYPAFYISSFKPSSIFRGKEKLGRKSLFSKVLLTFQFFLAIQTIIGAFIFTENGIHFRNKDWGYNQEQVITILAEDKDHFEAMKQKITYNANIASFSESHDHIGLGSSLTTIEIENQRKQIRHLKVGFDYEKTLGLRMKDGRWFERDVQSDKSETVVINQTFAESMGWDNPLDQSFVLDSIRRYVVGIVEDFHYDDFYANIDPVVLSISAEKDLKYLIVRSKAGQTIATADFLKVSWQEVAPDTPYIGVFQDEVFKGFHDEMQTNIELMIFISIFGLTLACIGLFGLVSFNITKRLKEFGIRKVLGASLINITKLINRDFVWILLVASLLGAPFAYVMMNQLISTIYAYSGPITPWPFAIALAAMLLTVVLTVSSQIWKVASENPTNILRNE